MTSAHFRRSLFCLTLPAVLPALWPAIGAEPSRPGSTARLDPLPLEQSTLSLAGEWRLGLDPGDRGIGERWFGDRLEGSRSAGVVALPGSLEAQGFGDDVSVDTAWTGDIGDRSWFTDPAYAAYRQPGRLKFNFWLTPAKHFVGPAWYQREVEIPVAWSGKRIVLSLERCHWQTRLWIDGAAAGIGPGSADSLSVPHQYDLSQSLTPGKHRLTLRVDNRLEVPVGVNAHSVSDHTQTNWNGVIGELKLTAGDPVWIDDLEVFPDVRGNKARIRISIGNAAGKGGSGELVLSAHRLAGENSPAGPARRMAFAFSSPKTPLELEVPLGSDARTWDEFSPVLYRLEASLVAVAGGVSWRDTRAADFGLREIRAEGTRLSLNGRPIFLRGTLECCIFPLTGYPPVEVEAWKRIIGICKAHGLNHLRFHSWCPPEAAFRAADELGFYYSVECAVWTTVGDGGPIDGWVRDEGDRILNAYGNHPSFLMLAHGNEPGGANQARYLGDLVRRWKGRDPRRLYTSGSGWPMIPENDYHVTPQPRIHQWGAGLTSRINARPPETETDYRDLVGKWSVPVIAHEIGQWCVYPNLDEIGKYTGLLKAGTLEIVRDALSADHRLDQARDYLMASGKLQALCYKEEIESALRTPGLGGFQLLDLHDFPGQGTALVGVLDAFWDSKGYITPEAFHRFAGETVPLARMAKRIFTSDETFTARIEVAHHGPRDLVGPRPGWKLRDGSGRVIAAGELAAPPIPAGALTALGSVSFPLSGVRQASRLNLEVALDGTPYANDWDFWVYPPAGPAAAPDGVLVASDLDEPALAVLNRGGKVLLLPPPCSIKGDRLGRVPAGFSSIFWNTAYTRRQAPHTLGIRCDPRHPALARFPTEGHSNWQWWELVTRAHPFLLDGLPVGRRPIVELIDDWVTHRRLGLVFEARVGGGSLLASGIDLETDLDRRPVARQLRESLLDYMAGAAFQPAEQLEVRQLKGLLAEPSLMQKLGARVVFVDSEAPGYEAAQAIDGEPSTSWITQWAPSAPPFPHEIRIALGRDVTLGGFRYLPRQDMRNGWFSSYELYVSRDGKEWGTPAASGSFAADPAEKVVRFAAPRTGSFVRLVALSGAGDGPWAAIGELDVLAAAQEAR